MHFGKYLKNYVSYKNDMPLVGKLKISAFHKCKVDLCVNSTH